MTIAIIGLQAGALEESQREFADARNTEERLRILGEGEAFLRDAIAVARAYSRQIPDPNELKRSPGTGKRCQCSDSIPERPQHPLSRPRSRSA